MVCTCRLTHEKIVSVDEDGDTVVTESGWSCSFDHCCDDVDHEWTHESIRESLEAARSPD